MIIAKPVLEGGYLDIVHSASQLDKLNATPEVKHKLHVYDRSKRYF